MSAHAAAHQRTVAVVTGGAALALKREDDVTGNLAHVDGGLDGG